MALGRTLAGAAETRAANWRAKMAMVVLVTSILAVGDWF